jgi:hypothetical protein
MGNRLENLLLRLYSSLTHLYPPGFRAELAEEMAATFSDALQGAAQGSGLAVGIVCLRELRDFPRRLIQEYWYQFRKQDRVLLAGTGHYPRPSLQGGSQPASWRVAFLAGLPHLIVAMIFLLAGAASANWTEGAPLNRLQVAALVLIWSGVGVIVGAVFFAWRRGWPRWAASYYFYWFLALAFPGLLIFQLLDNDFGYQVMNILLMLVYILILVVWFYVVTRRDAIKGLIMIAPVAMLSWSLNFEFIADEFDFPLRVGMYLVTALAAALITRFGNWRLGTWTVIGASMLVGLPVSYIRTFYHNIPPEHADPATFGMFSVRFAETWFWSALLIVAPLLLWVLWELGQRLGKRGRLGYRLAFTGILVNLTSILVLFQGYYFRFLPNNALREIGFPVIILLSAGAYFAGIALILRAAKQQAVLTNAATRMLLVVVTYILPFTFLFRLFTSHRIMPTHLPFGLFVDNAVPKMAYYGLGVLWLLLGTWLITRLRVPKRANQVP